MCALIKTGGGISEIRGSIGGTTFSRGRYGAIARNRSIPVQPNSEKQNAVRQVMGSLVQSWNALTDTQRANWITYANGTPMINRLGETIYLSGQNHYIRSNMCLAVVDGGVLAVAPTTFNLGSTDPTIALNLEDLLHPTASQITVTFNAALGWAHSNQGWIIIYSGICQNRGVNYYKGPWNTYSYVNGGGQTPLTSPQSLTCQQGDVFPGAAGQKCWWAYRLLSPDGRTTTLQTLPAQILEAYSA